MKKVQFLFLLSIFWVVGKSKTVGYNSRYKPHRNRLMTYSNRDRAYALLIPFTVNFEGFGY